LWYVAAMILVLGAYVFVVYAFVSRNSLQNLDQQLRSDYQWAAATVDVDAGGHVIPPMEPPLVTGEEELPWVQMWTGDGKLLLFQNEEAQRRRVPGSTKLNGLPDDDRGVFDSLAVEDERAPMRLLARRLSIRDQSFILQVGRSEMTMREDLRELAAILLLGLPLAVLTSVAAGLLQMIPFFGPFVSWAPPVIVALVLQPESVVPTLILMGLGWIVVMNVLQPRIMQGAVGIHPIVVLGSVLIGGRIAGIPGAIFGIPFAAVVSAFVMEFLHRTSGDRSVAGRAARRLEERDGRPVRIPREPVPGSATDIDEPDATGTTDLAEPDQASAPT